MGIYDRPYMREDSGGSGSGAGAWNWFLDHFNHLFIATNVIFWLLANGAEGAQRGQINSVLANLSLSFDGLQQHHYWSLLTCGMTEMNAIAVLFNMMLIYYFGRELAVLYGRINLIWLYFLALLISSGTFLLMAWLGGRPTNDWYFGGEALVMCVLVLFTFWYPRRMMYVMFIIPCPMFILTPLYIILMLTAFNQFPGARAYLAAPLAGAALGLVFYFLDLRIARGDRLRLRTGWLGAIANKLSGGGKSPRPAEALRRHEQRENTYEYQEPGRDSVPREVPKAAASGAADDDWGAPPPKLSPADAARVDQLLEKIANEGRDALTPDELAFLKTTSRKYR